VTSRAELERAAFTLFTENGFDETTVDDIAVAAGAARSSGSSRRRTTSRGARSTSNWRRCAPA
jgi:hypothetical protein